MRRKIIKLRSAKKGNRQDAKSADIMNRTFSLALILPDPWTLHQLVYLFGLLDGLREVEPQGADPPRRAPARRRP